MPNKKVATINSKVEMANNPRQVNDFLFRYPALIDIIYKLFNQVESRLDKIEKYVLELSYDREYHGYAYCLWLYVYADESIADIMTAIDGIDDWYFEQTYSKELDAQFFNFNIYSTR